MLKKEKNNFIKSINSIYKIVEADNNIRLINFRDVAKLIKSKYELSNNLASGSNTFHLLINNKYIIAYNEKLNKEDLKKDIAREYSIYKNLFYSKN